MNLQFLTMDLLENIMLSGIIFQGLINWICAVQKGIFQNLAVSVVILPYYQSGPTHAPFLPPAIKMVSVVKPFFTQVPTKNYTKFQEPPSFLAARLPPRFYNLYILLPVTDLGIPCYNPMFQKKND